MNAEERRRFLERVGLETPERPALERRMSATSKHRGWAAASLDEVAANPSALEDLEPVSGLAALLQMSDAHEPLYHANAEAGLWLLDPTSLDVIALEGAVTDDAGQILLDARERESFALVRRASQTVLLELKGAEVRAFVVEDAPSMTLAIDGSSVETPALDPEALMRPLTLQPWMRDKLASAEQGGPFEKVCAVGAAVRLWSTRDAMRSGVDVERLLRADDSPLDHGRQWYANFSDAARQATVRGLLRTIDRLERTLDDLVELVAARDEAAGLVARDWIERRDDLESAFVLIREREDGAMLERALSALDSLAKSYASTWRMIEWPPLTAQLEACVEEEAHAWWGDFWR
jgi:hypothetical protein